MSTDAVVQQRHHDRPASAAARRHVDHRTAHRRRGDLDGPDRGRFRTRHGPAPRPGRVRRRVVRGRRGTRGDAPRHRPGPAWPRGVGGRRRPRRRAGDRLARRRHRHHVCRPAGGRRSGSRWGHRHAPRHRPRRSGRSRSCSSTRSDCRPFDPAPPFGEALHRYLADPTGQTHGRLMQYCVHDFDGVRGRLGERWSAYADYAVDRLQQPARLAAVGCADGRLRGSPRSRRTRWPASPCRRR